MSFPKPNPLPVAKYGARLTQSQYERLVLDLNANLPPTPTPNQEDQLRRAELNAMIDYKLGIGFPDDQREQLLAVQKKARSHLLWNLAKGFLTNPLDPSAAIYKPLVRGFHKVLSEEDLNAYFSDLTPEEIRRFL